jgi:hypothetical protein
VVIIFFSSYQLNIIMYSLKPHGLDIYLLGYLIISEWWN